MSAEEIKKAKFLHEYNPEMWTHLALADYFEVDLDVIERALSD